MTPRSDAAEALRRQAMGDIARGHNVRAVRLLTRAIQTVSTAIPAPDSPDARTVRHVHQACLLTLATARLNLTGPTAAHEVLDQARELAGDDAELVVRWRAQRGLVLGRSGNLSAAEAELALVSRSLDVFTPQERCSILLNRGMVSVERAHPADALPMFTQAAEIAADAGLPRQRFMALHNSGYAAYLTGDLPAALAGMDAAESVDVEIFRGPALFDRGRVLHEAGLLDDALQALTEAAGACGRRGHDLQRGEIHLETARVLLLLDDARGASAAARRAVQLFTRAGAPGWTARSEAAVLTARVATQGPSPDAAAEARQLESVAVASGDTELRARAVCLAAELAASAGDVATARATLRRHPGEELGLMAQLARAHAKVCVELAAGRTTVARRTLADAARQLESSQAASASLDSRAGRAALSARLARLDLGLALDRHRATDVIAALERWSAAGRRLPTVRPPADPRSAELTQLLRTVLRRIRDEPDSTQLPSWRAEADGLRRRLRAADHASAQPAVAASDDSPRDTLDHFSESGRDLWWLFATGGVLWVAGVVNGHHLLRCVGEVRAIRERVRRLQADLRALSLHQVGPLRAAMGASLRSGLERLAALVPTPSRSVVVIECAEIANLPWAMVPSLGGVPVTVARAASEWLDRRSVGKGGVALLAGPGLSHSRRELDALARTWGHLAAAQTEVTCADAVRALGSAELVHLAAHGTHQRDSPLFSSLRLADGDLFAHELQPHPVRAQHVVLSACDVGSVTVRPGGEPLGFAGAMVSLGAASVVASVAPVADDAAADLMLRHHEGLVRGLETDAALAAASEAVPAAATFVNAGSIWRHGNGRA